MLKKVGQDEKKKRHRLAIGTQSYFGDDTEHSIINLTNVYLGR